MSHQTITRSAIGQLLRYTSIMLIALIGAGAPFSQLSASVVWAAPGVPPTAAEIDQAALPTVSISAEDPAAAEAGPDAARLRVVRIGGGAVPLEVRYTIAGLADAGNDYAALPGSVTIPAGASSATITIAPIDDKAVESVETVIVSLSIEPAYNIGTPTSATAMIADDDASGQIVSFFVGDSNAAEAGLDAGQFIVARDGSVAAPLTIAYHPSGTATEGVDYAGLPGSVTIPAGQASAVIAIRPLDDAAIEDVEIVVLMLSPGAGYSISAPASATVAIADNDTTPAGAPQYWAYAPVLMRGE